MNKFITPAQLITAIILTATFVYMSDNKLVTLAQNLALVALLCTARYLGVRARASK